MALTLTAAQLATALRLDASDADELAVVTRLLGVADALVTQHAPDAPPAIGDEAAVRVAGYLLDQPTAGRATMYGNAVRNSGAAAILLPWRTHSAKAVV